MSLPATAAALRAAETLGGRAMVADEQGAFKRLHALEAETKIVNTANKAVDVYTELIALPKEVLPDASLKALQTAYRNFEANATAENASALLKEVDASVRVASDAIKSGVTADAAVVKAIPEPNAAQGYIDSAVGGGDNGGAGTLAVPQGLSSQSFSAISKLIREYVGGINDDIVIQGSRASGTASVASDIDIAIRVNKQQFDSLIRQYFKSPNPGSAAERTMLRAIESGKIQAGEAKLSGLRKQLEILLGFQVDISIILRGGPFDNGITIPIL